MRRCIMKKVMNFKYNDSISTGSTNYYTTITSAIPNNDDRVVIVDSYNEIEKLGDVGKYSIFDIANWFLNKGDMTQKKLQKLCYYAQAWCYALKEKRLIKSDFQAWVHGPISPALYDRFKQFGYDTIKISGTYKCNISKEDVSLLEDIWETYGDKTGNALEALTHRELPWIEARRGYAENERCTVVISPEAMKMYYKSIYVGE